MPRLKKRADGRYLRTISKNGKKIFIYGTTEREVNLKYNEYMEKNADSKAFNLIAAEWWDEATINNPVGTEKCYCGAYKRLLEWFNNTDISDIKVKDVEQYLHKLTKDKITTKTIKNDKTVLSLVFKKAIRLGYTDMNPCAFADVPKGRPSKKRSSASEKDEQLIKDNIDVWLFPFFALYTGMRKGEILALRWEDINLKDNYITVNKSIGYEYNRPYVKNPKTEAGNRFVILLSPLKSALIPGADDEYVFPNGKDPHKPMTEKEYICKWKAFQRSTGITCTAHQLRHSFATFCFEAGLPEKVIQTMLGHTKISTTLDIYTDLRKKSLLQSTNQLEEYIRKIN